MVIATGFFDGVHLGHRLTLNRLMEVAKASGDESMVVTFWPHPRMLLQKDASSLRLLNSIWEKKRLLTGLGIDKIEVLDFSREFAALTAEQYIRQYLIGKYGCRALVLGYDNTFGSDCAPTEKVAEIARQTGLEVHIANRLSSWSGTSISSTWIRTMIAAGDMEAAAGMLGYLYPLYGVVVEGNRLGRKIGFPTANMQLYEPLKCLPGNGVYAVKVNVTGRDFIGMCNIGTRPTVGKGNARTIETNIFDFDEDIYGLSLRLQFLRKIRDEVKFSSMEMLAVQLAKDKEKCLEVADEF